MKPTLQQLEALARLRGSPDFARFLEVVQEHEKFLMERLVSAHDVSLIHRTQGGIEAIRQIREAFNSAPASIQRFSSNKEYA